MIFSIIYLIYVLLLVKFIFFTPEDKKERFVIFVTIIGLVMIIAMIIFAVQTRKATLLKEEIENKKSNCDAL